ARRPYQGRQVMACVPCHAMPDSVRSMVPDGSVSTSRCSRVFGHTSRTAAQKPSAPSPTATEAITRFATEYGPKYPKAVETLEKDADVLLTFFDFPAEHWKHLRTSNVIESPF